MADDLQGSLANIGLTDDPGRREDVMIKDVIMPDGSVKQFEIRGKSQGANAAFKRAAGDDVSDRALGQLTETRKAASEFAQQVQTNVEGALELYGIGGVRDIGDAISEGVTLADGTTIGGGTFTGPAQAFNTRQSLTRSKNQVDKINKIRDKFPGTIFRIDQDSETGESTFEAKLPGYTEYLPVDKADNVIAALLSPGDHGDLFGHLATFETAAMIIMSGQSAGLMARLPGLGAAAAPAMNVANVGKALAYVKRGVNSLVRGLKETGRITGIGALEGVATGLGRFVDESIQKWEGYQSDEWGDIANGAITVAKSDGILEMGMRGFIAVGSAIASKPVAWIMRKADDVVKESIEASNKFGIPMIPADLHPISRTGMLQAGRVSGSIGARINIRDAVGLLRFGDYFKNLGDPTALKREELKGALAVVEKRLMKALRKPGSVAVASQASRRGFAAFRAAEEAATQGRLKDARASIGKDGSFDLGPLLEISAASKTGGTRGRRAGVEEAAGGRSIGVNPRTGKAGFLGIDVATINFSGPIHLKVLELMQFVDGINPLLRTVGKGGRTDRFNFSSNAVDQMVELRKKAHGISDDVNYNPISREIASQLHQEMIRVMRNPTGGSPGFRQAMEALDTRLGVNEEIANMTWVRTLLDPNGVRRNITDEELGSVIFNLKKPDQVAQIKRALQSTGTGALTWGRVQDGYREMLLSNPLQFTTVIDNPGNKKALRTIFSSGEMSDLADVASEYRRMQGSGVVKLIKKDMESTDIAVDLMRTKDIAGLKTLVDELGGKDSPSARSIAAGIGMWVANSSTKTVNGQDILDKGKAASMLAELNKDGMFDVLLGKHNMGDIESIRKMLSMTIQNSHMGENLISAQMAQQLTQGIIHPIRGWAAANKLFANWIFGRTMMSPFLFRATGLDSPLVSGLAKHDRSFVRLYVRLMKNIRLQAEQDQGVLFEEDASFPLHHLTEVPRGIFDLVDGPKDRPIQEEGTSLRSRRGPGVGEPFPLTPQNPSFIGARESAASQLRAAPEENPLFPTRR